MKFGLDQKLQWRTKTGRVTEKWGTEDMAEPSPRLRVPSAERMAKRCQLEVFGDRSTGRGSRASGADDSAGVDLEMQQDNAGHRTQCRLTAGGPHRREDIPDDTIRPTASTTSQRAISIIVVSFVSFDEHTDSAVRALTSRYILRFRRLHLLHILGGILLEIVQAPLQHNFTSRPS